MKKGIIGKGRGLAAPEPLRGEIALPLHPRTPAVVILAIVFGFSLAVNAASGTSGEFRVDLSGMGPVEGGRGVE